MHGDFWSGNLLVDGGGRLSGVVDWTSARAAHLPLVDYFHLHGALRWTLILLFMVVKAGLIVAIFMHMRWERLALKLAILLPPLCLLVLIGLMAIEGDYTFVTRLASFVH